MGRREDWRQVGPVACCAGDVQKSLHAVVQTSAASLPKRDGNARPMQGEIDAASPGEQTLGLAIQGALPSHEAVSPRALCL